MRYLTSWRHTKLDGKRSSCRNIISVKGFSNSFDQLAKLLYCKELKNQTAKHLNREITTKNIFGWN